jgi:hypothetical protein
MHSYGTAGSGWRRPSLRQRAGAFALTILVELVVLLLVLAFGGSRVREVVAPVSPTSIRLLPSSAPEPPAQQRAAKQAAKPNPPVPPEPPRPVPTRPATSPATLPYLPMSKLDLAASDIGKLGTAGGAPAAGLCTVPNGCASRAMPNCAPIYRPLAWKPAAGR